MVANRGRPIGSHINACREMLRSSARFDVPDGIRTTCGLPIRQTNGADLQMPKDTVISCAEIKKGSLRC